MKHENIKGKIYVSKKNYLGRSETYCRGFCRGLVEELILSSRQFFSTCPIKVLTFFVQPFRL